MQVIGLFICMAALATLISGVKIQCDYQILYILKNETMYSCNATISNQENPTSVTEIKGTHMEGKSDSEVKGFFTYAGHENFTKVPNGIGKIFVNLEGFIWHSGNISSIDSCTFEQFPNLLYTVLAYNKIVTLDGDLFRFTRKLRAISFQLNMLEHVGYDLLSGLTALEIAAFDGNPCVNATAETSEETKQLNIQLPIQCPPTTSELKECPTSGASWIGKQTNNIINIVIHIFITLFLIFACKE